jgi:hypothetical protein
MEKHALRASPRSASHRTDMHVTCSDIPLLYHTTSNPTRHDRHHRTFSPPRSNRLVPDIGNVRNSTCSNSRLLAPAMCGCDELNWVPKTCFLCPKCAGFAGFSLETSFFVSSSSCRIFASFFLNNISSLARERLFLHRIFVGYGRLGNLTDL